MNEVAAIYDQKSAEEFLVNRLSQLGPAECANTESGLAYSQTVMSTLGKPQEAFPSLHVAGTSGKGSTTHYLSSMLKEHGFLVGTLISPHVRDIRERAMVDLAPIAEQEFVEISKVVAQVTEHLMAHELKRPRFTELLTAIGFLACQRAEVDYAVVETILGGRYDPTNTITRVDKFSVITNLGLDHEKKLGQTKEEVAWHKAGIFTNEGQAMALLPPLSSVKEVLDSEARKKHCDLTYIDPQVVTSNVRIDQNGVLFDFRSPAGELMELSIPTLASYQVANSALALSALFKLAERDEIKIDEDSLWQGLANVNVPARMEIVSIDNHNLVIDSATNPQKLRALVGSLKDAKIAPPVWIFGTDKAKNHHELLSILDGYSNAIVFAEYFQDSPEYLSGRCAQASELEKIWRRQSSVSCLGAFKNVNLAFAEVNEKMPGKPVVIAGSIYMIGEFNRS